MGTLVDVQLHVEVEGIAFRHDDNGLRGVAEIGEFHQLVHLTVGGERRVEQHVVQVGGA